MDAREIRIVIPSRDWRSGSSHDLEEPLDEALRRAGLGEITRGGAGPGELFLVAEVTDVRRAAEVLWPALTQAGAPPTTRLLVAGSELKRDPPPVVS